MTTLSATLAQQLPAADYINPLDDATLTVLRRIATPEEIVTFAAVLEQIRRGRREAWLAGYVWEVVGRLANENEANGNLPFHDRENV